MRHGLIILFLACAISGPVAAEYTVKGSLTCESVIREDGHEHFREYNKWWLLGYFTARNFLTEGHVGRGVADDDIYRLAFGFCLTNLGSDWDQAAVYAYDIYSEAVQ